MGLTSGGRPTVLDLTALVLFTLLGYGWIGMIGAVIFGGSLLSLFVVLEWYILRPAEQLEEFEKRITDLEDEKDEGG